MLARKLSPLVVKNSSAVLVFLAVINLLSLRKLSSPFIFNNYYTLVLVALLLLVTRGETIPSFLYRLS